jgi:two-component system OmpR family response regulator
MKAQTKDMVIERPRIKIFLVDDDALYLKVLESYFLESNILEVSSFATGEECLLHLSDKPDVVVLDYFLNGKDKEAKNGLAILKKIKAEDPKIQVIMLSSHENVEIALDCISCNAFNFIVKNETTFLRLKHSIKQIFHRDSVVKELIVWDW